MESYLTLTINAKCEYNNVCGGAGAVVVMSLMLYEYVCNTKCLRSYKRSFEKYLYTEKLLVCLFICACSHSLHIKVLLYNISHILYLLIISMYKHNFF